MLLLTLLLSNKVRRFGGVSMNPLMSSRMVTRGYSLTRTHSERNDKEAFLSWNMAPTPTAKHTDADVVADAEGFTASENVNLWK
jgi:hypothetical protein